LSVGKNLALLQAEASACGFGLANVPNVRRLSFTMNANGLHMACGGFEALSCPQRQSLSMERKPCW